MKNSVIQILTVLTCLIVSGIFTVSSSTTAQYSKTVPTQGPTPKSVIGDARHLATIGWSFNPMQYSAGYVLGTLVGVHKIGRIIQTLEGSVKIGQMSSAGGFVEPKCLEMQKSRIKSGPNYQVELQQAEQRCTVLINPWPFSSQNQGLLEPLAAIGESEVVLYYKSYFWVPFTRSNNYLQRVYLVDPTLLPPNASYTVSIPWAAYIPRLVTGFYVGRVVQASLNNVIRKAREIVVQQGRGGGIYNQISVPSRKLFNFIIKAMATGRYMRVYYYQLIGPLAAPENLVAGYNTDYRAYKVQLLN